MKTRTDAFDVAWGNRRVRKASYYITCKRRYWNGAAYVLESSAFTIPKREIDNISGLSSKFDIPLQNRILPANVSITLLDKGYRWLPSNTANGKWRKDATATVGYEPVGSEFTIYYGYFLADETTEYLAMFTGIVQDDPSFDSINGTATFQILERSAAKLEAARAQNVCTTVTDQATSPASGAGVVTAFNGLIKSVWEMTNVRVAGVTKTLGDANDYTVDNLNDAEVVPTINFVAAPTGTILYNGKQWYRDQSISTLVGLICDEAGIASGDRIIEEPIFSGVDQSSLIDTGAQWIAGSYTNADPNSLAGTLRRKWHLIENFTAGTLANWQTIETSFLSFSGGKLQMGGSDYIERASTKTVGTWEVKLNRIVGATDSMQLFFIHDGSSGGYAITYVPSTGQIYLARDNSTLVTTTVAVDTTERTVRVTRTEAGLMSFYVDTALIGSVTDTTYTTSVKMALDCSAVGNTLSMTVDDIYFSNEVDGSGAVSTASMVWTSPEIDMLAAPTVFLPLLPVSTLNGGSVAYTTQTATVSGGPYDAAVAVDVSLTPTSALKRYAKVIITADALAFAFSSPEFEALSLRWRGSSLFIKSADFTGLSGLSAVQELAKIGGMEFGAKGDGTFFFRNKSVTSTIDLTISQKTAIIAVSKYSTGYKDVRTIGVVRYGKSGTDGYYNSEYKAADASEASPTTAARFGNKTIELDLQRFIFSNDALVSVAIARKLYELNYRPKRKLTIKTRIIAHLDPSDKLSIRFHDSPLIEKAIFGDPLQRFPVTGPNARTLARDILMKVIGHAPDIMRSESTIDLEEVLS